ncbi:hypothetical protein [Rubritalea tangerina]|uniref:hypothetical protein n=1 Tax=Rubritalea tangerina TaxID=430798 RepID=UPI003614D5C9
MKTFVSIFLILSTVALSIMSLVQLGQVDFASEFSNADAKPTNTRLFDHDLRATANVVIESNRFPTHAFSYSPENGLWMGVEPWQDRADGPKAIEKLVLFALNAEIQDSLPATPDNLQALGFEEQAINILFTNSLNDTIANFSIGATSAWHKKIEGKQELLIPTVYLRLRNSDLDDHIYLCTDTPETFRNSSPINSPISATTAHSHSTSKPSTKSDSCGTKRKSSSPIPPPMPPGCSPSHSNFQPTAQPS